MKSHKASLILIFISNFLNIQCVPEWQNLECEENHKYFFSEATLSWFEAAAECELYGGWLVNIGGFKEQNCLVRYGQSQLYDYWFWHDGNAYMRFIVRKLYYVCL